MIQFNYFPHIIRRFSAHKIRLPFGKLFWLFFGATFITNIYSANFFPISEEKELQMNILKEPGKSLLHEKLGLLYLTINKNEAYKEYLLAQENFTQSLSFNNDILGTQSQPIQTWQNLESFQNNLSTEISYWDNIYKFYPEYQFALTKIGSLYIELGDYDKARKYINEVLKISPTDPTALKLIPILLRFAAR